MRCFNISTTLPSLIFDIDNISVATAETCIGLKHILFSELIRRHITINGTAYSTATSRAVIPIVVAIHATALSVSPLNLLIDVIFQVLLAN